MRTYWQARLLLKLFADGPIELLKLPLFFSFDFFFEVLVRPSVFDAVEGHQNGALGSTLHRHTGV